MPFIYITGAPGVGKSTLQKDLNSRGLKAFDIDDPKLGGVHNKASGERVAIPPAHNRPPEWFKDHEWRVDHAAIRALKDQAAHMTIFICGVAPGDENILDLFDMIFYLGLDENNLRQRVATRTDNDYGKNSDELAQILERKRRLDARYGKLMVVEIDATKSPDEIADFMVSKIKC